MAGLEIFKERGYVGRVIVIGRDITGKKDFISYAVTGRSFESRSREIKKRGEGSLYVTGSSDRIAQENSDLLYYNCVRRYQDIFVVSNGIQTDLLRETVETSDYSPVGTLVKALEKPFYVPGYQGKKLVDITKEEPDEIKTPRICGILSSEGAALSISKSDGDVSLKYFFDVPLKPGRVKVITTYKGGNPEDPPLPFKGEPLSFWITTFFLKDITKQLWDSLGPKEGERDLRAAIATVAINREHNTIETHIRGGDKK